MKFALVILLLIRSFASFGQILDSCGINNNSRLNRCEAEYLNKVFESKREGFDFANQKVVFLTGSGGSVIGSKISYFRNVKNWVANNDTIVSHFILLSEDQIDKSGGFSAIVTYWVKVIPPTEKVIRRLRKNSLKTQ